MKSLATIAALTFLCALLAVLAYIRLAASDPRIWNAAISDTTEAKPGPCVHQVRTLPDGARATCILPGSPAETLRKLTSVAMAYPRTTQLAGTPDTGRITWVSRSRVIGFPDYTTAQVMAVPGGTRLDVHARLRFGSSDLGVNAARLKLWLAALEPGQPGTPP
jgi:uncharacterized protein (DUF1499 family)